MKVACFDLKLVGVFLFFMGGKMKKGKSCKLIVFVFAVFLLGIIVFNVFLKQDQKFLYAEIKQTDQSDIGEYEQIFCESVLISIDKVNEKQGTAKITVKIPNLNNIYDEGMTENEFLKKLSNVEEEDLIEKQLDVSVKKDGEEWKLTSVEKIDSCIETVLNDFFVFLVSQNGELKI